MLRPYQQEAVNAVVASTVGRIQLPTGTGKSTIQAAVIENYIRANPYFKVYVILTPRILLTNQLMATTARHLKNTGIHNIKLITIHSGSTAELYDGDVVSEEDRDIFDAMEQKSCKNAEQITSEILNAQVNQTPTIVCCTYQSVSALVSSLVSLGVNATQVLCDEAHYVCQREFHDNVAMLKTVSDRMHFFTATQRYSSANNGGLGMNNVEMFGEMLYRKTPLEMVQLGWMVQPRIHTVESIGNPDIPVMVTKAFDEHQGWIQYDARSEEVNAKVLVCCNGNMLLKQIHGSNDVREWATNNDVTVFAISSDHGAWVNNEEVGRDKFLETLRSHRGKALVLHIAILTEGIDVPDMSGVLFLRDMNDTRFGQSLGRVLRVLPSDSGVDFVNRTKKYGYAIVVDIVDDVEVRDRYENITSMVHKMRMAEFEGIEYVVGGYDIGDDATGDDELDPTNIRKRRVRDMWKEAHDEVDHIIEDERIANLVANATDDKDFWAA